MYVPEQSQADDCEPPLSGVGGCEAVITDFRYCTSSGCLALYTLPHPLYYKLAVGPLLLKCLHDLLAL